MMRSLYTAALGMYGQQLNVDTIAHNMANVNTNGYKKERVEFQDLLYQTIKRPASGPDVNEPVRMDVGLGVKPVAITSLFTQGNMQNTEIPTDVAIIGDAFFKVQVPGYEDPLFTRDGAIKIDADGQMVTADGYLYVGADVIPEGAHDVAIGKDGTVTYIEQGATEPTEGGQLELAKFINPAGLAKLGEDLYQNTPNSGEPLDWEPADDSTVKLESGYLEMSNVHIAEEMVSLITAQRAYEINSKVIQSSDEMLQTAANLRR